MTGSEGRDRAGNVIRELSVPGAEDEPVGMSLHLPPGSAPCPALVMAHGFKGFKDWGFLPALAADLASAGIAAVRVGFSHNGTGQGAEAGRFTRLDLFERDRMSFRLHDLQVAVHRLLDAEPRVDRNRLAGFGHSLGGAVALIAMHRLPFQALVTLATVGRVEFPPEEAAILEREGRLLVRNARTGDLMPVGLAALRDLEAHREAFDLERAARQLDRPWLLIHGSADASVPVSSSRRLAAVAPPNRATLEIIEDADHAMDCQHPFGAPPAAYARMRDLVVAFLRRVLGSDRE